VEQLLKLHEQVALLALAFRAGLASHEGKCFAIKPASAEIDRYQGTDLFLLRGKRSLRIDLTEASPLVVDKKVRRSLEKSRGGGHWVQIVSVQRESVLQTAVDPCFRQAYEAFISGREMRSISLRKACPRHGNRCSLAGKLLRLSSLLNLQLGGGRARNFQMTLDHYPPLP